MGGMREYSILTAVSIVVEYLQLSCFLLGKVDDTLGKLHQLRHMYTEALVTHTRPHLIEKGQHLVGQLSCHMTVGYCGNLISELSQFVEVCGKQTKAVDLRSNVSVEKIL